LLWVKNLSYLLYFASISPSLRLVSLVCLITETKSISERSAIVIHR
jgi:hypothetical protein